MAPLRRRPCRSSRAALLALSLLVGCRGGSDAGGPAAGPGARRYTVRAEVVALPRPQSRPPQLTVRHEAIPGFVDREGATVGMPSMVMPLDLGPGASAGGLVPGDKVELVLAVDWGRPLVQIEQRRKLPAETVLRLAPPPAGAGAGDARPSSVSDQPSR